MRIHHDHQTHECFGKDFHYWANQCVAISSDAPHSCTGYHHEFAIQTSLIIDRPENILNNRHRPSKEPFKTFKTIKQPSKKPIKNPKQLSQTHPKTLQISSSAPRLPSRRLLGFPNDGFAVRAPGSTGLSKGKASSCAKVNGCRLGKSPTSSQSHWETAKC